MSVYIESCAVLLFLYDLWKVCILNFDSCENTQVQPPIESKRLRLRGRDRTPSVHI